MFPSRPARAGRSPAGPGDWGSFLSQAYVLALAEVARQGSRQHHISKTRGACGGHNSRTRPLATPAPPTPPPPPPPRPAEHPAPPPPPTYLVCPLPLVKKKKPYKYYNTRLFSQHIPSAIATL